MSAEDDVYVDPRQLGFDTGLGWGFEPKPMRPCLFGSVVGMGMYCDLHNFGLSAEHRRVVGECLDGLLPWTD